MWQRVYTEEIRAVCAVARDGWLRGLTAGSGGNISLRCQEGMLITRSGSSFRTLTEKDILLVDFQGMVLAGEGRPSIETGFHLACYEQRPEMNAVYHIHSPYGCYFAARNQQIPLHTVGEKLLLGEIPLTPYAEPGSRELAEALRCALAEHPDAKGALLSGHGLVALGQTINEAYDRAECMEAGAKLAWLMERENRK